MSTVQERIQENEHRLILNRQSLAHMEKSSWRHMSDIYSALGDVTDPSTQGLSLYERTKEQLKIGIDELEETYNIILRREGARAEAPDLEEPKSGAAPRQEVASPAGRGDSPAKLVIGSGL